MNKIASFIHRTGLRLAQPDILFFTLPLLMGLLVIGTLAQKTIGIYAAEKQFFGAFLYWLGPLPLPAGLSLMGIFLINLTAKFFFKSEWSWHRAGSLLAHFGVLLLILGAIVTTLTAREGYIALHPFEISRTITDYHGRNLVVRAVEPKSEGEHKAAPPLLTLAHEKLKDGLKLGKAEGLPFDMTITKYCFHCEISRRDVSEQAGWTRPGKFMMLNKAPADPQDEKNMTGIEFEIKSDQALDSDQPNSEQHSGQAQDTGTGTKYLTFDGFPKPPVITHGGKTYQISIERTTRPLPFSIKLNRFTREFHPGTQMERAFASDVTIIDPGHKIEFPARIEMNAPLRYRGYTIYQSSFDVADGVESTVLSIVENKGQIFPYISSIIIACGLLLHLVRRMRRSKKLFGPAAKIASVFIVLSAALIVSVCPPFARPALADDRNSRVQNQFDYHDFAEIPVLHEGRVKPLDTLARIELRQFLGREEFDHHAAIVWLAQALFDPAASANQAIFKVENPAIRHMMGLSERARPIYSFVELSPGLKKTFPMVEQLMDKAPASLSGEQKSLLTIHENALEYTQIMRSFSLILPLNVTIPAPLRDKLDRGEPVTYLTLKKLDQTIQSSLKQTIAKKGQNPEKYSPTEQQLAMLGWQIKVMEDAAQDNRLMKVITSRQGLSQDQDQTQLVAPWEIVNDGRGGPDTVAQLQNWQKLAGAYMTGDAKLWLETAQQIKAQIEQQSLNQRDGSSQTNRIKWEIFYNQVNPFLCATSLYAASFAALLLLLSFPQITGQSSRNLTLRVAMTVGRLLWGGVWIMMGAAILLQIYGLGTRIFVLARPPVGTLYESILFVGMVAPLFSLLSELKLNNRLGLLCAAMGGTALGILALTIQTEGDHMKVLGAVLNTQFWLTVHVLCITIGYGWCLVTSILAHLILVNQAWGNPQSSAREDQLYKLRRAQGTLALTALLFTTIGTILGGIWADQSWGRFWGWDPKENGALLIVLWLVWILHGKIAGQLSVTMASVGYAFLSVIVGVAWIGVNLLGVGLHSYGFTEGLFWGLGVFTLIEIVILSILVWKIRNREANQL